MDEQVNPQAEILRFGEFELDVPGRLLSRDGEPIRLPPRIHTLLEYFVARPGTAVTREELIDELWQGVAVSDQSLTEAVWRLRRALGDEPKDPRYIETIPGFGFRFIAAVEDVRESEVAAEADWVPLWKLALPGAVLSGLMLMIGFGAVYLWAGGVPGERVRLAEITLPDGAPIHDFRAELSPQDDRLAFVRSDPPRLEVLDLETDELRILGALSRVWNGRQLRWSPDGSVLALSHRREPGGPGHIELFDLDSGSRTTIFEYDAGPVSLLGWHPDGDRLLALALDTTDQKHFVLIDRSGTVLAEWAVDGVEDGRVSPDGRWLALWVFPDPEDDLNGEIVIVPIEALWEREARPGPDAFAGWPNSARISSPPAHDKAYWNRNSDQLVYFSNRGGGRALWFVDLDEGRPVRQPRLMEAPGAPYMVQGWLADGRILFCSFDTGWDVFLADFDPESLTLTSDPALVSLWAGRARLTLWSHEPDRLMYASFHEDAADGDLYVATLSDDPTQPLRGEPERIAVQGAFRYPQWDSARGLVYFSRRLEERGVGLFVVDVDSGQERRLLPDQTLVGTVRLALTDAGRQLLFSSAPKPRPWLPDPTLAPGLYLYDVESEQVRQLLGGETHDHGPFAVSPDGDLLAMTDVDGVEVQLVAIDGAQRRVIATAPGGGWTVGALSFLPDRRTLAYAVTRELPESFCGESELWLVDLSGDEPRRLEGVAAYDLQAGSWSPDGRRFAFSSWKCDSAVKLFEPY